MRSYKALEFDELMEQYAERFSPVPDGVLRSAANLGLTDKLASDLSAALEANKPIPDWGSYAKALYRLYAQEKAAGSTIST